MASYDGSIMLLGKCLLVAILPPKVRKKAHMNGDTA
jgi:hypothetical protein